MVGVVVDVVGLGVDDRVDAVVTLGGTASVLLATEGTWVVSTLQQKNDIFKIKTCQSHFKRVCTQTCVLYLDDRRLVFSFHF